MFGKKAIGLAVASLPWAAAGCFNGNVDVGRDYYAGGGGGTIREEIPAAVALLFNDAFAAVKLPAGAVAPGEYVAVYRLGSGEAEDRWWYYLAEDWLVAKVAQAGATAVERNAAAAALLAAEGDYVPPPAKAVSAAAATKPGKADAERTPYRATRALAYRVVAIGVHVAPRIKPHKALRVKVTAEVTLNLRTLDVASGEVLWTGTASGTVTREIPLAELTGWCTYAEAYDWEDDGGGWWWWRWGAPAVSITSAAMASAGEPTATSTPGSTDAGETEEPAAAEDGNGAAAAADDDAAEGAPAATP